MKLTVSVLAASLVLAGCATGPKEGNHLAHHPSGVAAVAAGSPTPGQMDSMMKSMQAMHDQMMAAKSSEERTKLMEEHMNLMKEGMGMMGRIRGGPRSNVDGKGTARGGMAMSPEMMLKHMDMMEMMMRMMMDREAMRPPAAK